MSNATLIVGAGHRRLSRADLEALPDAPQPRGPLHHPHRHITVVGALTDALTEHGLRIADEQFALNRANTRLLGTLIVEPTTENHDLAPALRPDSQQALALVSSQDSTKSLKITAGTRVLACTNGVLSGQASIIRRRHVKGLQLSSALRDAVDGWIGQQLGFARVVDNAKALELTTDQLKAAMFNVFEAQILSPRLLQPISETLFRPDPSWTDITEFPRSAYAVHSAITRCLREAAPAVRYTATQRIAYLLSDPLGDPRRN